MKYTFVPYSILLLFFTGCMAYWVEDTPVFTLSSVTVKHVSQKELWEICTHITNTGCSIKHLDTGIVEIYLGPSSTNCTLREELKHAAGWSHDKRAIYRMDCGDRMAQ